MIQQIKLKNKKKTTRSKHRRVTDQVFGVTRIDEEKNTLNIQIQLMKITFTPYINQANEAQGVFI